MKSSLPNQQQKSLFTTDLIACLNPNNRLNQLAQRLAWSEIEKDFESYYSNMGQPAKPIRLMVGLLMIKQLANLSDEVVVERWCENPYYQRPSRGSFVVWLPFNGIYRVIPLI